MASNSGKFLTILIDTITYNRIIRFVKNGKGGGSDVYYMCDKNSSQEFLKKLQAPNEFIRLKCQDYYMDFTLDKFKVTDYCIIISFDKLLDYNRTKFIPKPQ